MNRFKGCPFYATLAGIKKVPKLRSAKNWIRKISGRKVCFSCKCNKGKKHKTRRCHRNHIPVEPILLICFLLLFVAPSIETTLEENRIEFSEASEVLKGEGGDSWNPNKELVLDETGRRHHHRLHHLEVQ